MTDPQTQNLPRNDDHATGSQAFEAGRTAGAKPWLLYLVGAVSILAGAIAIAVPFLGTVTAAFVVGASLIASGVVGVFTASRRHDGWHVAAAFAIALLSIAVGLAIFVQPIAAIFALTTLVIAWFAASGLLRVWYGAKNLGDGGGWVVAFGVLSVALALLLWFGLPFSAAWILGVLLGADLIVWGALLIAFTARAGRLAPAA